MEALPSPFLVRSRDYQADRLGSGCSLTPTQGLWMGPVGVRRTEAWPLCLSSLGPAHHSWEMASSAVIRWSCSTSISLVTRSLAGDKARERLGMAPSHCLEVVDGLGGRSRIRQRRLRTGPPHQPFAVPGRWAPPHPPGRCHPSTESQIHSRQQGSCGRDSCHGSRSHLPPPPHRKAGSLKACIRAKGQGHPGRPRAQAPTPPGCKPLFAHPLTGCT